MDRFLVGLRREFLIFTKEDMWAFQVILVKFLEIFYYKEKRFGFKWKIVLFYEGV